MVGLLKVIIFIMVFAATISAQSIPNRLDSLRLYCALPVDLPDSGNNRLSTAEMNKCINLAVSQVCTDFPAYVKFDTLTMKSTIEGSAFNSDFRDVVFVFRMTADTSIRGQDTVIKPIRTPIPKRQPDTLRWLRTDSKDDVQKMQIASDPTSWFVEGQRLFIHPTWSDPDTGLFLISYYAMDTAEYNDTGTYQIDREYMPRVVEYARGLMYEVINKHEQAGYYFRDKYDFAVRKYWGMQEVSR